MDLPSDIIVIHTLECHTKMRHSDISEYLPVAKLCMKVCPNSDTLVENIDPGSSFGEDVFPVYLYDLAIPVLWKVCPLGICQSTVWWLLVPHGLHGVVPVGLVWGDLDRQLVRLPKFPSAGVLCDCPWGIDSVRVFQTQLTLELLWSGSSVFWHLRSYSSGWLSVSVSSQQKVDFCLFLQSQILFYLLTQTQPLVPLGACSPCVLLVPAGGSLAAARPIAGQPFTHSFLQGHLLPLESPLWVACLRWVLCPCQHCLFSHRHVALAVFLVGLHCRGFVWILIFLSAGYTPYTSDPDFWANGQLEGGRSRAGWSGFWWSSSLRYSGGWLALKSRPIYKSYSLTYSLFLRSCDYGLAFKTEKLEFSHLQFDSLAHMGMKPAEPSFEGE